MIQVFLALSIAFAVGAGACVIATLILLLRPSLSIAAVSTPATARMGLDDAAKLVEAAAKLTAALSKAGPAVVCALLTAFFGSAAMYFAGLASAVFRASGP